MGNRYNADRRALLGLVAAGGSLATLSSAHAQFGRAGAPPDVGSKFYPDGRVHPFRGNTVICHLPQQGPDGDGFEAFLDTYRDAPRHQFTSKVTLLPPSSYHMTVFGGANDRPRQAKSWPADLSLDAPMDRCDELVGSRLRSAKLSLSLPIKMRVDPAQSPSGARPLTMGLLPYDDTERRKLAALRQAIAAATRIPLPGPDTYRFHVSIGYPVAWLTTAEENELRRVFADWAREIAARAPVIRLGSPEYCTFDDMFAFERQFYLGDAA